jgi:transposase
MARDYGRSPRGERCHDHKPKNWGDNITVIGAITLKGMNAVMTLNGALDRVWFDVWVEKFLAPSLKPGDIVVLDNLSTHKSKKAQEIIESTGAKMMFLPAYSPDLNPIEKAWSKLKALIRAKKPRLREQLEETLVWALDQVSKSDAESWYQHSGYC